MSRPVLAVSLLLIALLSSPAEAQLEESEWPPGYVTGESTRFTRGDRLRCENEEHRYAYDAVLDGCSVIVSERYSRKVTAYALLYRALLYRENSREAEAVADSERARDLYSDIIAGARRDWRIYSSRGSVHEFLEHYDLALADFDRALEINPRFTPAFAGRGRVLFRHGEYQAAIEAFDAAARYASHGSSGVSSAHYGADQCVARAAARVEWDEAARLCQRTVRHTGGGTHALVSRGYLYFMQGRFDEAGADFARAFNRDPLDATAVHARGVMISRTGNVPEGEVEMNRAIATNRQAIEFFSNAGLRP